MKSTTANEPKEGYREWPDEAYREWPHLMPWLSSVHTPLGSRYIIEHSGFTEELVVSRAEVAADWATFLQRISEAKGRLIKIAEVDAKITEGIRARPKP